MPSFKEPKDRLIGRLVGGWIESLVGWLVGWLCLSLVNEALDGIAGSVVGCL